MKKFIFPAFVLVLLMFSACKKSDNISGVVISRDVNLSYVDQNGNDLLSSSTPHAYDVGLFRLEYYNHGKLETYFKSNYTAKYGVGPGVFYSPSSQYLAVRIFPPADTIYLKLSNGDVDTIWTTTDIENNYAYQNITKVWYNGKLMWDEKDMVARYIVIKKHIN